MSVISQSAGRPSPDATDANNINSVETVADETGVPVSGTIRIGHDPATAILNTVEQRDSDTILMGWRGRGRRRDIVLGSNVDEVVTKARCDVLVKRISPVEAVESILLPTAGGPHAELAAEIAVAIARPHGAKIDVIHVIDPSSDESERERAQEWLNATAAVIEDYDAVETRLIEGQNVVNTIVEATKDHDHTIIGATREGLLQQVVFGTLPEKVGRRAKHTVFMAKRYQGLASRFRQWVRSYRPSKHGEIPRMRDSHHDNDT